MSRSNSMRACDVRALIRLAGECRELGDDPLAWRSHLLSTLADLVDADLGSAGEMRGCRSLRVADLGVTLWMRPALFNPALIDTTMDDFRNDPARTPILLEYFRRNALAEGACLARTDLRDDKAWYASNDYQVTYRPCGTDHILFCFRPIAHPADDDNAGLVLARAKGRPPFGGRELLIVGEAHAAIAPLIGGPLARYADPSPQDLTPRVRQVLACLLEGESDKQIAARLSMSPFTVNQHTKAIFRHFGCRGRVELLARSLRRTRGRS